MDFLFFESVWGVFDFEEIFSSHMETVNSKFRTNVSSESEAQRPSVDAFMFSSLSLPTAPWKLALFFSLLLYV